MKQPRVKVDAHVILWRGLLLIYGCLVFGDTSESVNEVLVRAFLFVYTFGNWTNHFITSNFNYYKVNKKYNNRK